MPNQPSELRSDKISTASAGRSGQSPEKRDVHALEAVDDPHRLATSFITEVFTVNGVQNLLRWRGEWHVWDGARYLKWKDTELRASLTQHVKTEFDRDAKRELATYKPDPESNKSKPPTAQKVTRNIVSNVIQALESLTHLSADIGQPFWLGDEPSPVEVRFTFPTENCLLDLQALGRGNARLVPPTPMFFSPRAVTYSFDPAATCPEWIKFLRSIWPSDTGSVALLQEYVGYCLTNDTSQHKFLMMVGPPRSGKGTIGRVFKELVGQDNVASPTLNSLAGQFGLWPLLSKTLAIVADARLSGRSDSVGVVERLLSIVGEDPQDVDRKCLPPLTATRLSVRFLVMSNEVPSLTDASSAIVTRTLMLRMTQSFTDREDRNLESRLLEELPGILNWAIAGWQRLSKRGYFEQPATGQELVDELKRQASPISEFIDDCCDVGPEFMVPIPEVYQAYKDWCSEHGRDHAGTESSFGRNLRAAVSSLNVARPGSGPSRQRVYTGIGLKHEIPEYVSNHG